MTYYPILRGKLFELVCLRENAKKIAAWEISPVIEPVRDSMAPLIKALKALEDAGAATWLIANPVIGGLVGRRLDAEETDLAALVDESLFINWVYQIWDETDLAGLDAFLAQRGRGLFHHGKVAANEVVGALGPHATPAINFFREPCGERYRQKFPADTAVGIEDGFSKQPKNSMYPPDEVFSDLNLVYETKGFTGFGDYLIVGADYAEGGGPAHAVAIHITYRNAADDGAIHIKHFVSDSNLTPEDTAGKFSEALTKLVREVDAPDSMISRTSAIQEFKDLHRSGHFPGLGYVKKLGIQHHLELLGE